MMNCSRGIRDAAHAGVILLLVLIITLATAPAFGGDRNETSGDILRIALPAAAFALTVKRGDREGRLGFYRSFGATVVTTALLKQGIDKRRPDRSDDDAFPSGHTSMAFQGAAFIHRRYGIRQAWPAYVAATWVGWTRIDADEHDVVDVLGGAALGLGSAFLLARRAPQVQLSGSIGPKRAVLTVSGQFGAAR